MSIMGGAGMGGGLLGELEHERLKEEREQKIQSGNWGFRHDNRIIRAIWAPATLLVVLLGVATGEIIVSLVAATVLVAGWAAWTWTRYALNRLESEVEISQNHAFVGETLELTLRLENRKVLPLTALQVRINLPEILEPSNEPFSKLHESAPQEGVVVRSTSLRWYERLIWNFQIPLITRGHFRLARIDLKSGDLFGVYRRERSDDAEHTLWVYPEVISLDRLGLPRLRPQGEQRGGQRLFEDPTRLQTIRDYRPGDPLKKVDWKATARRQSLQSRVYDPSSDLIAMVALNVSTLPHAWQGFFGDIFERAVSVAASLANGFAEERVPVGLLANCTWPGHDTAIRVPASRAPGQMTRILEALAMADVFTLVRIERMLSEERLTYGSTLALVTAVLTPALESSLLQLKRHGAQIGLIYVGIEDPPSTFAESPVYDIRSALEGLHFERVGEAGPWARTDRLYARRRPPEPVDDVNLPTFVGGDESPSLATASPEQQVGDGEVAASAAPARAAPDSPWARPGRSL
ncbi:MAG: DUF58 domain-containing protein [Chloroflexota bacterium]|nr:DUF58 domain-containing protein [Chloroflexota bacterium]